MTGEIPDDVRALLLDHIGSVTQLEALLLLRRVPETWTPEKLARELRIEPAGAAEQLEALVRHRLVERAGPGVYRYAPHTAAAADTLERLSALYDDWRVAIINLIYSRPKGSIQVFADAFRLRKDDKEE